ncbi:MAG: dTDP-4-amino-4,6-dideoxygalactose transaminase [Anaerofustis sp.]
MIDFNIPLYLGTEEKNIIRALQSHHISGDGAFTHEVSDWICNHFNAKHVLLTTSGTHALEMSALLAGIKPGDEVIMPSFTFSSTANAFVLQGAKIVFVDIRPDTMNLDETLIEQAITSRTKAIVPVHYAGVSAEMDAITDLAERYSLKIIEDAAQGFMSEYKGCKLGNIGEFGCFSFHESKNFNMGEGGAILIKDDEAMRLGEIIREKGTNRSQFMHGFVDKYTWVDYGSSYLPSDINAAYLMGQLEYAQRVTDKRVALWERYSRGLEPLQSLGYIECQTIPKECKPNGHIYYLKCKNLDERSHLISYLKQNEIQAVFHYLPLHSSPAGKKYGRFCGEDRYTTKESERLLRLPMFYDLTDVQQKYILSKIYEFYGCKGISHE